MTETIQMRTTQEQSGNYRVFAGPTINGLQRAKGLAVIQSAVERLGDPDFIEAEFSEEAEVELVPDKWTGATGRYETEGPAIRHVYLDPELLSELFDWEAPNEGEDPELPESVGITIRASSEEQYEESKQEAQEAVEEDAEVEVEGLVAGDAETQESEDAESESDDSDSDEEGEVEISDEEVGLTDA